MHLRYIIFDFDGTICDSYPAIDFSLEQTFLKYNLRIPAIDIRRQIIGSGKGIGDSIQLLNREAAPISGDQIANMTLTYREIYANEGYNYAKLFPGALNLFSRLHDHGIIIIIASNKGLEAVKSTLDLYGLNKFTSDIIADGVFTKEKTRMKPDPMIFEEYIKPKYPAINSENGMIVGDTDVDIRFAKNCDLISCWAAYGYGNTEACIKAEPHFRINSLSELSLLLFPQPTR
jgi:phosphoglycolate phosphatase